MATSESEDFESADEELNNLRSVVNSNRSGNNNIGGVKKRNTIGSDSDDDEDFIPSPKPRNDNNFQRTKKFNKMDSKKNVKARKSNVQQKKQTINKTPEKKTADVSLMDELRESEAKEVENTIVKTEEVLNLQPKKDDLSPDTPAELKSNLKFKDIFKPDGWEGLDDDVELPDSLSDDKYQPVLDKLTSADAWSSWGSWGVTSLINTATAGVSQVTSQVSRGLTLLEESMGIQEEEALPSKNSETTDKSATPQDEQVAAPVVDEGSEGDGGGGASVDLLSGFGGFGSFLSSMSNVGSSIISGGLDTLETIGKKTMEVLQEGDPGLKKKRAFFFDDDEDKPILSQLLREAKERAEVEEKSQEEKQLARKVHFESIFDDYQGLVHLEALEMLSKQCNIKIQQKLVDLTGDELSSLEETLEEIKELCDLGDEEDDEVEGDKQSFEEKLKEACQDLGISVTFEKLVNVLNEIESNIPSPDSKDISHLKIFQDAILAIAQFTALSVERFHKSAELLLVKERRSTVNETDALVQLTKILCHQVGQVANLFCNCLSQIKDESEKSIITTNITTTYVEATNASSYIQEGFRLLIPILQVGAI